VIEQAESHGHPFSSFVDERIAGFLLNGPAALEKRQPIRPLPVNHDDSLRVKIDELPAWIVILLMAKNRTQDCSFEQTKSCIGVRR
jgi:hypothetical protein